MAASIAAAQVPGAGEVGATGNAHLNRNAATFALEISSSGRPTRKSTRKAANRSKPDSNLHRRQIRRARSPRARVEQGK
jgi:hypothetical protein